MITNKILLGAIVCITVFIGIIMLLFFYLVYKRRSEQRFNHQVNTYIKQHENEWYNHLVKGEPIGKMGENFTVKVAIDKIFVTYITTINNKEVRERISKYASLKLQGYYQNQLKSSDLSIRLNVLQRTLLFELDFMVLQIERKLKKNEIQSVEEYILALRMMAKYNSNLFLAHLYKPRMKFNEYDYKVILAQVDVTYITHIKQNFEQLPIHLRLALLEYLSFNSNVDIEYLTFYEELLSSVYKEIRIRALKSIAVFGMLTDIKKYEQFVHSNDWEERLMVAKILRFAYENQAHPYLQVLIKDSQWQVRKQAAQSLKGMRGGNEILLQIIEQNEDMYASDMAREVLKVDNLL